MGDLYTSQSKIADAIGVTLPDLRALIRVLRPDLRTVQPRHSPNGKLPRAYLLRDVVEWLSTVGDILTPQAELILRGNAEKLEY